MKTIDMNQYLRNHPYPGRGILLGRSADNKSAVIAYFIMGRSANSRNRVFTPVPEDNGIKTEAYDPSKMEDPSLIIYHPVRYVEQTGDTVVTNGDQTDTVRDGILSGLAFAQSLRTRCFEPDPPNYTPRIHTYQENLDPLPSFEGEPRRVAITAPDADTLARELWDSLNQDNKVSLFVRYIDLATGHTTDRIINKNV